MSKITSIKSQKDKNRVNIYLDGKFGFGLDLENFVLLGLKVGQDLDEEKVLEITAKGEFQKIYNKLLSFVTRRPRSEKEINDWFYKHKVNKKYQEGLKRKLKRFGFLDDDAFAKWWVEQRLEFRPKPKSILYNELRIKGIDKEIIRKVLEETNVDEEKVARELIRKNIHKWRDLDKFKARQKMGAFLARKGFGWDVIKKAINENFID